MKKFRQFKEELINELSSHTLGSYAIKAHQRADTAARMSKSEYGDKGTVDKNMDKLANKRADGAALAVTKLGRKTNTSSAKADATTIAKLIKTGVNQAKDWKSPNKATNDAANWKYNTAHKGIGRVWDKADKASKGTK